MKTGILAAILAATASCSAAAETFSWNAPNATVDPKGDIGWAPRPFAFTPGKSVRFIDFEAGDDDNDGLA